MGEKRSWMVVNGKVRNARMDLALVDSEARRFLCTCCFLPSSCGCILTVLGDMSEPDDIEFVDCSGPRYTSSAATRERCKSKRPKKGGKPGHPGSFSKGRLALFEEYQPEFNKLGKDARTDQNTFWKAFFKAYWKQFPYTVPLKEEPTESAWPLPNEDDFTEDQRKEKGKTLDKIVAVRLCY